MYSSFQYQFSLAISTLVLWSLIMWLWMYLTRIPAIIKAKMKLNRYRERGSQMNELPPKTRWVADNYNHLTEQPTHFYAISFIILFLNIDSLVNLYAAWFYVIFRIIHSLIQSLNNIIVIRFAFFTMSAICLFVLTSYNVFYLISKV